MDLSGELHTEATGYTQISLGYCGLKFCGLCITFSFFLGFKSRVLWT